MNKSNDPIITVLMTVYKSYSFLSEAIESILNQTFERFELLIIVEFDSNKEVIDCVRSYETVDERIRVIINEKRLGMAASLNAGIEVAKGKYIARMDDDDISLPERLDIQYEFMENNPHIGLCGTLQTTLLKDRKSVLYCACDPCELKGEMLFGCQLSHTSIMFRRQLFLDNGWRYPTDKLAEDYSLWLDILDEVVIANIPMPLVKHRYGFGNISIEKGNSLVEENTNNIRNHLEKHFGINLMDYPIELFYAWRNSFVVKNGEDRIRLHECGIRLLAELFSANSKTGFVDAESWKKVLSKRYEWLLRRLNIFDLMKMLTRDDENIPYVTNRINELVIPLKSRIIIFGMGKRYIDILKEYGLDKFDSDYDVVGCCDSTISADPLNKYKFILKDMIEENNVDYILISTSKYFTEIKNELMNVYEIPEAKIALLAQCFLSQTSGE